MVAAPGARAGAGGFVPDQNLTLLTAVLSADEWNIYCQTKVPPPLNNKHIFIYTSHHVIQSAAPHLSQPIILFFDFLDFLSEANSEINQTQC